MLEQHLTKARLMFASWIVRHPRSILAWTVVLSCVGAALLLRFRIDPDIASLFPKGDPTLRLTRHLQGDSPPSRTLFIVLRGEDPKALEDALPKIVDALRSSPFLARIVATRQEFAGSRYDWVRAAPIHHLDETSLGKLEHRLMGPERKGELEALVRRIAGDPLTGKELALRDPLGLRWILEEAAETLSRRFPVPLLPGSPYLVVERPALAFLRAVGTEDAFNTRFTRELLEDVRSRLKPFPIRVELAGGYVSTHANATAMRADMIHQSVSSSVLVLLFLTLFSRKLLTPFLLILPVGLSILLGLSLGQTILGPLTPLVVSASAILVAQGIDFPVHFYSRYRQERADLGPKHALLKTHLSLGRPFLGAAGTTLLAFAALGLSRFPGFRQFGIVLALGFALCLVASLTLLPALLARWDRFILRPKAPVPLLLRLAASAFAGRTGLLLGGGTIIITLAAWMLVTATGIRIDLDVRNSMPPGDPGLETIRRLEADLGVSMTPVFALVNASTPQKDLGSQVARLVEQGAVAAADGIHSLQPSPESEARVVRFRKATEHWVEETLVEMAAVGLRPEAFRKGLLAWQETLNAPMPQWTDPAFAELRRTLAYDAGHTRSWVLTLFPRSSLWTPSDRSHFDRGVRGVLGRETQFFSAFHLPDHYGRALMEDLVRVSTASLLGIVLLSLLILRHPAKAAMALVPGFVAIGTALAVCVLQGGTVNLMNMVAFPIVLGIGVDSGFHYVCWSQETGRSDPQETLLGIGPGVWGSTATTLLGFGSITFSKVPGLSSMGLLVAAGAIGSCAATFLLLPLLSGSNPKMRLPGDQ